MNVIIYTRVSTDEQANSGYSLPHQETVLRTHCDIKGYNIVKMFKEDYSAKNFDRPEFKKLLEYVKANKKSVDAILFTRWDRFSRNTEEAYRVIREFRNLGMKVDAVEQPLDLNQPDSKVMLAVYLAIPEVENDKNSIRTTEGMRKAMRMGCYMGKAPFGYKNARNKEDSATLEANPKTAPLVVKAFKEFSTGIYSAEELRKILLKEGLKVSKQGFLNMLQNPLYTGKLRLKEWKNEPSEIIDGLHDGIIEVNTFNTVQDIFNGKKKD